MSGSEIHPILSARAVFHSHEIVVPQKPTDKTKVILNFVVECINKKGQSKKIIPLETAALIEAFLSVKVDPKKFDEVKHLLKSDIDLNLTVCPLAWKVENGSGMFFDLIEVEKFDSMLEAA